jgi:hypothetical protein
MQETAEIDVQSEAFQTVTQPSAENILAKEIEQLWSVHSQAQTVLGRTKEELRTLRLQLGRRLYEMKVLLASPGRGGKWSKFLSEQRIARASADRYSKCYEVTLNPPLEIASSEAIQDSSSEETARKVLQSVWPKLRDVLTDQETAYKFLCALVQRCDTLHAEITESGIEIRKPSTINSQPTSSALEARNDLTEAAATVQL